MNLQTNLALKIDEIKRQAEDGDANVQAHIASLQSKPDAVVDVETDNDLDEKDAEETGNINPFFREPLYSYVLSNPPESSRKTSFMNFSFVLQSWKFNRAIKWNAILSMDCVHQVFPLDIPYNSVNSECPVYSDLIA